MPGRARVQYNLGLLLQRRGQLPEAESYLMNALKIEPDNMDYLYALADHYLKRSLLSKAEFIATQMIEHHPNERMGHDLLMFIHQKLRQQKPQPHHN